MPGLFFAGKIKTTEDADDRGAPDALVRGACPADEGVRRSIHSL